jgi:Tol biopolymer transport system component
VQQRASLRRGLTAVSIASVLAVTGLAASPALAAPSNGTTELVTAAPGGGGGNAQSWAPSVTADGRYVTFMSLASNLTGSDTSDGKWDVFVKDNRTGAITKVSTALGGAASNGDSNASDISDNGRYVVFESTATNLVAGDQAPNTYDLFVKDLKTNKITRLITKNPGVGDNGHDTEPSISADGSVVAFRSTNADLVPGDTNGVADIFVWKRSTAEVTRVSVSSAGEQSANPAQPDLALSVGADLSADGKTVVFMSGADNLVPGDTNGLFDIFVHTLADHRTTRVSVGADGQQATGGGQNNQQGASQPSISANGRYIAYQGYALKGLVEQETGVTNQVYAYDRKTGLTQLVAHQVDGTVTSGDSDNATISPDGRFVAFQSYDDQIVTGDTNGYSDVFVRDLKSTRIAAASIGVDGEPADGPSGSSGAAITAGGGAVVFDAQAHNLIEGPVGVNDLFLHRFPKRF